MNKTRAKSWDGLMSSSKQKCRSSLVAELNLVNIGNVDEKLRHYSWLKVLSETYVQSTQKFEHVCEFDLLCKDFEIKHQYGEEQGKRTLCFCFEYSWIQRTRAIVNGILRIVARQMFLKQLRKDREIVILSTHDLFDEVITKIIGTKKIEELIQELNFEKTLEISFEQEFIQKQEEIETSERALYEKVDNLLKKGSSDEQMLALQFVEKFPSIKDSKDDTISMSYSYIDEESSDSCSSATSSFTNQAFLIKIGPFNESNLNSEIDYDVQQVLEKAFHMTNQSLDSVLTLHGNAGPPTKQQQAQLDFVCKILSSNKVFVQYCIFRSQKQQRLYLSRQKERANDFSQKSKIFEQSFGSSFFDENKKDQQQNEVESNLKGIE